jgi:hypothetical protein
MQFVRMLTYRTGFFVVLLLLVGFIGYHIGYVSATISSPSASQGCAVVWTGPLPDWAKPFFHTRYGNASDTGVYAVYHCTSSPTDALRYCTHLDPAMAPVWLRSLIPANANLYSCQIG